MKKLIAAAAVATTATVPFASSASAEPPCPGGLVSAVASTWPFAHDGAEEFAPPTGGFAKWVPLFTPFDNPGEFVQFAADVDCVPPEG